MQRMQSTQSTQSTQSRQRTHSRPSRIPHQTTESRARRRRRTTGDGDKARAATSLKATETQMPIKSEEVLVEPLSGPKGVASTIRSLRGDRAGVFRFEEAKDVVLGIRSGKPDHSAHDKIIAGHFLGAVGETSLIKERVGDKWTSVAEALTGLAANPKVLKFKQRAMRWFYQKSRNSAKKWCFRLLDLRENIDSLKSAIHESNYPNWLRFGTLAKPSLDDTDILRAEEAEKLKHLLQQFHDLKEAAFLETWATPTLAISSSAMGVVSIIGGALSLAFLPFAIVLASLAIGIPIIGLIACHVSHLRAMRSLTSELEKEYGHDFPEELPDRYWPPLPPPPKTEVKKDPVDQIKILSEQLARLTEILASARTTIYERDSATGSFIATQLPVLLPNSRMLPDPDTTSDIEDLGPLPPLPTTT